LKKLLGEFDVHDFLGFFILAPKFAFLLLVALIFSGCASHGGYRPTVDPYGDPRADRIGQDL
jgi:hypothetical protein